MKKILFLLIVLLSVFFSGCNSSEDEAKPVVDNSESFKQLKALSNKTYSLKTVDGKPIILDIENNSLKSDTYKNKIVLINFWATWCPPCIKEIPVFNELYEKYSDKFEIIGVLFEKNKDEKELQAFIEKYNIKFPITVGDENFRMAKFFNDVKKVPESYLYSKEGIYTKQYIGEVDKEDLENYIKSN